MNLIKVAKIGLVLSGLVFLAAVNPARAQYYGQGEDQPQLVVDKKIRIIPGVEQYDNVDRTFKVFYENDMVEFSVLIKNTGNKALEGVKVADQLPVGLSLLFHPGEYDEPGRAIGWLVEKLDPGEAKTYLIRAKISDAAAVDQTSQRCNKAEAWVEDISDNDTACYFVGVKSVPNTGDASLVLKTVLTLMIVGTGVGLRKFARGY